MEALLDLAAAEFARQGYHATSIAGICRQGGLANASFYRYFKDKRQVHDALVERVRTAFAGAVARATGLDDLCEGLFDCFEEHGSAFQVFREAEFLDEGASASSFYDPAVAGIRTLLGVDEATAWAFLGALVFVALRFGIWDGHAIPDPVRSAFREFVREGLA